MIKKQLSRQSRTKEQFLGFLRTPPLWQETAFGIQQFPVPPPLPHLLDGAVIPQPVHGPLGKRMESFFQFYLEQFSDYRILAHNIQIQGTSATVGEIDFLIRQASTDKVLHIEQVYKLYLYQPAIKNEIDRWIGPNKRDTLVKKIDRLHQHQLPMLYSVNTKPLLENLDVSTDAISQYVCFKAQLFLPRNAAVSSSLINPSCIVGSWIRYENFTQEQYGKFSFFSPLKQDWSMDPSTNNLWYDFEEINRQVEGFINQQRSPLLWMRKSHGAFERMFVVWW